MTPPKSASTSTRQLHSPGKEVLCVVSETEAKATRISKSLSDLFYLRIIELDSLLENEPSPRAVVDIDLNCSYDFSPLRSWFRQRPCVSAIFSVDRDSRIQLVRAFSLGASDVLFRPFTSQALRNKLLAGSKSLIDDEDVTGIEASLSALQNIFLSASTGSPLNIQHLAKAGDALVGQIETHGFADWVQAVRAHHIQTYQHCLLVAGAAAAFSIELGFGKTDRRRVATAGLLHDVGKARVPVAILDKPAKLDREELAVVRQHPQLGFEALLGTDGLHPEMLEIVMNHHELLDGSGYPRGLGGAVHGCHEDHDKGRSSERQRA